MSKRILINGKGKYVGDNVATYLSSKKPKSTLQVLDEDEEATNDGEKFKVCRTSPDTPREDVLSMALESDYIIWDVSDMSNTSDNFGSVSDANWLIENLGKVSDTFDEAKQFILISTVATWARSKPKDPEDPDVPFDESDYRVRRSHVSFKEHLALEKAVVKAGKTFKGKLVCYVVASGIQYGNGESTFHYMFKQPWLDVDQEVAIYGNGKNRLPMIHVTDLAQIITNVVDRRPSPKYIVAVDQGMLRFLTKMIILITEFFIFKIKFLSTHINR